MAICLGVDTGGTYTDAVLVEDDATVLASAKALTTRGDLAHGIGAAVAAVLRAADVSAQAVGLASLSTTLATNALIEGQGGRVALVLIGFSEQDVQTHGLADALGDDPILVLAGGHSHAGAEVAPLDLGALELWARAQDVSAFAVAAQFATRNPAHEAAAADLIARVTGRPVSASHHLSAKLGGPKRAVTAVLNARLIGLTHRLVLRAADVLGEMGVTAPLMVVRGDGALMSAAQAQERPIETILSGPAASLVGARWLTGADTALVSDIGGTTTDVALLRDGRPALDPAGAQVGRWRTMVEAVAMRTHGLGGDSEIHVAKTGLTGGVTLGPRRLVPVSLIAQDAPDIVHAALDAQLRATVPGDHDGRFVRMVPGQDAGGLGPREAALLARIGENVHPLGNVLRTRLDTAALSRLVSRGLIQVAGATPTDAVHVLGRISTWDGAAAEKALALVARRRVGSGDRLAASAQDLAVMVVDAVTRDTGRVLLESAFAEEGWDEAPGTLAQHSLLQAGLNRHSKLIELRARLAVPVIGLGASARCYYPAVGEALGAEMILPADGGVANAIGAVVGRISMRRTGVVTAPAEGRFRVHLEAGPEDFAELDKALERLETSLRAQVGDAADAAGAQDITTQIWRDIKTVEAEGRAMFLEAHLVAEANGRPRVTG